MNTLGRVKAVIGDVAGIPAAHVGDDQPLGMGEPLPQEAGDLTTGLGFDSLDFIELVLRLEEHFAIEIPEADVDKPDMGTARGIATYIDATWDFTAQPKPTRRAEQPPAASDPLPLDGQ